MEFKVWDGNINNKTESKYIYIYIYIYICRLLYIIIREPTKCKRSIRPQGNAQTSKQTPNQVRLRKSWPKASSTKCKRSIRPQGKVQTSTQTLEAKCD